MLAIRMKYDGYPDFRVVINHSILFQSANKLIEAFISKSEVVTYSKVFCYTLIELWPLVLIKYCRFLYLAKYNKINMIIKLTCTFTLVILFNWVIAQEQKDFVVTIQGDTLYGKIKLIHGGKLDRVQINADGKKNGYTSVQVNEILFNNDRFHPVELGGNIKLMKLLKYGFLSLYGYRIENEVGYSGRVLRKIGGAYIDIPVLTFRSALASFISECEPLSEKVKRRELGRDELEQVVIEYNQCLNQKTEVVYQQVKTKVSQGNIRTRLLAFARKVELSDLINKSDVTDVLNDMMARVESNQAIPKYQAQALKDFVQDQKEFEQDLNELLRMIEK